MSTDEICTLKRYFELKSSHVSDYWLQCCLEWYKESNYSHKKDDMCNIIYQQWLESDIRDIEVRCLPKNLTHQKVTTLNGKYVLQVMYTKDISKSAYSQLKHIRDMYKLTRSHVDTEDTEQSGKRMLYLQMTDGIQYIHGYEYQSVSCLNLFLTPGIKLLLTGPLTVRNGEILLKENNVAVLGGDVEDLKITNAAENVLARELNIPENPNPLNIETKSSTQQTIQQSTCTQLKETNIRNNEHCNSILEDDQLLMDLDPSVFEEKEITSLAQINSDFNEDDDLFENFNITENENNQIVSNTDNTNLNISSKLEQEYLSHADTITEEDTLSLHLINKNQETLIDIKYLLDNLSTLEVDRSYRVKACFFKNVEKLLVSKTKGWTMKFEIKDTSGSIIVNFRSDVIENLMGLSPAEALAEKRSVKNKEIESHEKLLKALQRCRKKLENGEYLFDLRFNDEEKILPIVTSLQSVTKEIL